MAKWRRAPFPGREGPPPTARTAMWDLRRVFLLERRADLVQVFNRNFCSYNPGHPTGGKKDGKGRREGRGEKSYLRCPPSRKGSFKT